MTNKEYNRLYPNHCPHCGGWGMIEVRGCSVPYGSTWVSLPSEDEPCPKCQDEGLCPRCLTEMDVEHEDSKCPSCGWKWGDSGLQPDNDPEEWELF